MTNYEHVTQLTEIIANLEKDIATTVESKKTVSSQELPELEQYQQHLENTLQGLKAQLQEFINK
jgi:uncharacterized protein YdcH (DUF465 family)